MISFEKISNLIHRSKKIGLTYHVSPDGDAVGSLLAFYNACKSIDKKVVIFSKDDLSINKSFKFLPSIDLINGENFVVDEDVDLLVIFDCGNLERVSCDFDINAVTTLGVDHHVSNDMYCTYNHIDKGASSTGEIVYSIIKFMGINITDEISKSIYTSIMTDTGGLRFQNATQKTFNIVGDLVSTGLDFWNIYEMLFLSQSYSKIKLLSDVFKDLKILDTKICIMHLNDFMLVNSGAGEDEIHDLVSRGLTIEGVHISVLIKDIKGKVKVSLRSRENINVCEMAKKFGGGGHIRAAAFVSELSSKEIEKVLIDEIRKIL